MQSPPCGVFLVRTQRKTFRMRWGTLRVKLLLRISIINRPSLKINILALISIPQNLLDNLDSQLLRSVWRLHAGKHRSSGEAASVFVCDTKSGASNTQLDVARCLTLSLNHFKWNHDTLRALSSKKTVMRRAAVKRLKTLRHPSVLTFLAECDSPTSGWFSLLRICDYNWLQFCLQLNLWPHWANILERFWTEARRESITWLGEFSRWLLIEKFQSSWPPSHIKFKCSACKWPEEIRVCPYIRTFIKQKLEILHVFPLV